MTKKILSSILIIIISVTVGTAVFFSHPKKSQAFLGVGDVVLINIKAFTTELLQSIVATTLDNAVKKYANTFINQSLSKYKIRDLYNYTNNLKNTFYTDKQLQGQSAADQFVIKSIIGQIGGLVPGAKTSNLTPLFTQAAVQSFDITKASSQPPSTAPYFLAAAGNFNSTPYGQEAIKIGTALDVNAKATAAAHLDITTSQGFKSSYSCGAIATPNLSQAQNTANCLINNPGQFISATINSKVNSLFGRQNNAANNHWAQIAAALGNAFANEIDSKILK